MEKPQMHTDKWKNKITKLIREAKIDEVLGFSRKIASKNNEYDEVADFLDEIGVVLSKEAHRYQEALLIFNASLEIVRDEKLKKAIALNCAVTHSILGNVLGKKKKFEESEGHFKEALKLSPDLSIAHSEYAYLLLLRKRYDASEHHFKQALKLEPTNAQAHINYAILLDKQKRPYEATVHCKEALTLNPNNPVYNTIHGITLMNMGLFDEAESHFKIALSIDPQNALINFSYAKLLSKLGKWAKAKNYFALTLQIDSNYLNGSISHQYAILMEVATDPRSKITNEWLEARKQSMKFERDRDLRDFELQKKHRKEWKILYDNFQCLRCGKCCRNTKWISDIELRLIWEDIKRWREEGRDDILQCVYVYEGLGGDIFNKKALKRFSKCPFLEHEGNLYSCSIHETKPHACKLHPFYFNHQGKCENCGTGVDETDVYCKSCNIFLKVNPFAYHCPGMKKTLKSLGLYKKVSELLSDSLNTTTRSTWDYAENSDINAF